MVGSPIRNLRRFFALTVCLRPGSCAPSSSWTWCSAGGAAGKTLTPPRTVSRSVSPGRRRISTSWSAGHRVKKVDAAGILTTVAGRGTRGDGGDGGPGIEAQLNGPHHVAVPAEGKLLYIADTGNNRVRTLDPETGIIRSVVGTGEKSFGGDWARAARGSLQRHLLRRFRRSVQRLYAVDLNNRRIRVHRPAVRHGEHRGRNGEKGGPPTERRPRIPPRSIPGGRGRLEGPGYIVERNGNALRVVGTDGRIRTVSGPLQGYDGDGGDARAALLNGPKHTPSTGPTASSSSTPKTTPSAVQPDDGRSPWWPGREGGSGGLGGPPEKWSSTGPTRLRREKRRQSYRTATNHRVVKSAAGH